MVVSLHVYKHVINQHLVGQSGKGLEQLKQLVIDSNYDYVEKTWLRGEDSRCVLNKLPDRDLT